MLNGNSLDKQQFANKFDWKQAILTLILLKYCICIRVKGKMTCILKDSLR